MRAIFLPYMRRCLSLYNWMSELYAPMSKACTPQVTMFGKYSPVGVALWEGMGVLGKQ